MRKYGRREPADNPDKSRRRSARSKELSRKKPVVERHSDWYNNGNLSVWPVRQGVGKDMKIICFGDSNTYGYDPRSYFGGRYSKENRWVDILAAKTGWQIVNLGENGRSIPQRPVGFPAESDLLIVMLGTNDLLQGRTPEETVRRMEHFLRGLPLAPEKVLLVAPPPMDFGEWVTDEKLIKASHTLARVYQMLAEQLGIAFADGGNWNVTLAYDGVHFTEQGHRAFADGIYKEIIP